MSVSLSTIARTDFNRTICLLLIKPMWKDLAELGALSLITGLMLCGDMRRVPPSEGN